ncbi:hypothetical protein [Tardiphaga sp. P9-11]|uniref:hypothetical protein n=1 Tax=Tardiphaga sp. P9-11 TaxID=2024614 RepID=UPI0011F1F3E7|nr:hypothetical protein [Tardiphaga sp. P9-11]
MNEKSPAILSSTSAAMVYYEAWPRLKPDPGRELGPFKSSDPFDADTVDEAEAIAVEWMSRNVPDHHEAEELWLHEGTSKRKIWP